MKVLVCGSRHFNDYKLLEETLDGIDANTRITEIIHGAARGADTLAGNWADGRVSVGVRSFPAEWDTFGRRAGPIRNYHMLKQNPDLVVAFIAPNSRGTKHMIDIAKKANIPVK